MSNSSLICYTNLSPNCSSPRNHAIDTIAIHCMAGHLSLRDCGNLFSRTSTGASSNYGINDDGEIGMFVEECDRSWATSSREVDNRAVTIEVASDADGQCWVTDAALASVITLCTDICQRNNIAKLIWADNKSDRVNRVNGANMMVHRDYADKACPGDYLYSKMPYIASEVNKRIDAGKEPNYIVDGLDYRIVYDYDFYINKWPDLREYYGDNDKQGVFNHFLRYGMKESRQAKADFNVKVYKDNYEDLREAYKDDMPKYYQHYIKWGCNLEHRNAVYHIVPINVWDGYDYSLVYDADFYKSSYKDLQDAFGDNYDKLIQHFVNTGMKERRIAKSSFNVNYYMSNYEDLRKAYGSDYPKYFYHYITAGYKEGRVADKKLPQPQTTYKVQKGDTVSSIAAEFHLKVDEFLALNGVKFKVGQVVKIK